MVYYEIRIEPKKDIEFNEIKKCIEKAFLDIGLSEEGVELINFD